MKKSFYVRPLWDDEASVFISETNVPGLSVEAETLDDFLTVASQLAADLLEENLGLPREGRSWILESGELVLE